MDRIERVKSAEDIEKITKVINLSFQTVAEEYGFSKQNAPTFPAYIKPEIIENTFAGSAGISDSKDKTTFKIERLAVLPEYRHYGIGKKLMDFAYSEIVRNSGKIAQVEIVNENTKLKSWYKSIGFYEIRIDTYQHLPFTVCVLNKDLEK